MSTSAQVVGGWRSAFAACRAPANLRRTCAIALVVGTILTLINQGDVLFGGGATAVTGAKIAGNYIVPFVVSNLGVLAATRTAAGR